MNFDKFKKIDMPDIKVNPDLDYVKKLNNLAKEPKHSNALRIVGTIAAAVVIVLAVSLWALIGRGVRGTGNPTIEPPATEGVGEREQLSFFVESTKEYELTSKLIYDFKKAVLIPFKFTQIPLFNEDEPITAEKIKKYFYLVGGSDEINAMAKKLFNFEGDLYSTVIDTTDLDANAPTPDYIIQSIAEHTLSSGHRIISIVYTMDGYQYTLDYIAKNGIDVDAKDGIDVDRFYMHTKNGPIELGEITVENKFHSIAAKYAFDIMYDFELGTLPEYIPVKYYISQYYQQDSGKSLSMHGGTNDWRVYGYPVDEYYKYMNELFGGYTELTKITPISEVTGPKYYDLELVKAKDGTLLVPIEAEGYDELFCHFVSSTEGEYNGQKTVTVEFEVVTEPYYNYSSSLRQITYTTTDGVTPDKFIECKTIN